MQLKSLELHGFKSFPDKTIIEFNDGLTAVVGPNGSGKSNISDAIRWVLGEQSTKSLRGGKMEDVIFTGTQKRNSLGNASVTLIIDNANKTFNIDENYLKIKRKYYRNGDSEYYLNDKQVRLKDVNEVLMDTGIGKEGFSIISQGKITDIISSKSQDRREFFETAAGISKFRHRKEEAIKNLQDAEDNLLRLNDILRELNVRLAPLEEQSKKAKQFIELSARKKDLDIFLALESIKELDKKIKEQQEIIKTINQEYRIYEYEINEIEEDIKTLFEASQKLQIDTIEITKTKEKNNEIKAELVATIAVLENNVLHTQEDILTITKELDDITLLSSDYDIKIDEKESNITKLTEKLDEILNISAVKSDEISSLTEKSQDSFNELLDLDNTILELKNNITKNQFLLTHNSENIDEYNKKSELLKQTLTEKKDLVINLIDEKTENEEVINSLNEEIISSNNIIKGIKMKLDKDEEESKSISTAMQNTYLKLKDNQNKIKVQTDLANSLEGFSRSVLEIVKATKTKVLTGIYGTVFDLLDTKPEYSIAIETAMSYSMQNIVVVDEYVAKNCLNYLKTNNFGRATFMPLTSVKGSIYETNSIKNERGFIGNAVNLVIYSQEFNEIFKFLLGRIVIIDNIDNATIIAKKYSYKFKIVTLDGQVINAGGTFTGGSVNKGLAPISRKHLIDALVEENKVLDAELNKIKEKIKTKKETVSGLNDLMDVNLSKKEQLSNDVYTFTSNQNKLEIEQHKKENEILELNNNLLDLSQKTKISTDEVEILTKLYDNDNYNLALISAKRDEFYLINEDIKDKKETLENEVSALLLNKMEISKDIEILKQSLENFKSNKLDTINKTIELNEQKTNNTFKINSYNVDIKTKKSEIEKFDNDNNDIVKIIKENDIKRLENEKEISILRNSQKEKSNKKEKLSSSISRITEQENSVKKDYDSKIALLYDEYVLTRTEAIALNIVIDDAKKAPVELASIKALIRELGTVNVAAIDEYLEVKSRHDFLHLQISDINKSKTELINIINDLTKNMKERFTDSFTMINNHFKRIFKDLFGGGNAYLKLTDPSNVLDCGIDIFVQPPGKIVKSLSLLSGGEQAFIAIAIYFALLYTKPTPFCVLDEIEAALDEVNVVKYAHYLRQLSDNIQFILITHRRGTMEEADTLYGVTMQDEGVSRLLKLESK